MTVRTYTLYQAMKLSQRYGRMFREQIADRHSGKVRLGHVYQIIDGVWSFDDGSGADDWVMESFELPFVEVEADRARSGHYVVIHRTEACELPEWPQVTLDP